MLKLLLNAELYTPDAIGRGHVLVAGESIAWLGKEIPALPHVLDVEVSDLDGLALIPGLIDGHAHVTGGGGESGFASRVPPVAPEAFSAAGVTSVIGLLGTDDTTRSIADLLARTRGLVEEGLSAWCHCGGYHLPPATLTGSVRGDIVHIDRIVGVGELALSDHRSSQPTLDELLRVAADAHVAGMMTGKAGLLHLHLGDGPRGLDLVRSALDRSELPPRVFNPTHVNRRSALFDEALDLAARGCTIDITAFPVDDGDDAIAADVALRRYLDADLPSHRVTVSSDGGGCLPVFDTDGRIASMDVGRPAALAETLRALLAAGVPLAAALPAFTSNVAGLLRLPGKGRIAAAADADLVTLDAGGAIRDVMARGRWHVRNGDVVRRGLFSSAVAQPGVLR